MTCLPSVVFAEPCSEIDAAGTWGKSEVYTAGCARLPRHRRPPGVAVRVDRGRGAPAPAPRARTRTGRGARRRGGAVLGAHADARPRDRHHLAPFGRVPR